MTTPTATPALAPTAFPDRRSSRAAAAVLCVVVALAAAIGAVIATDAFHTSRAAQDQDNYHLRAVRTFAEHWGHPDFSDYRSATTPGYHLTLAAVSRFVSEDARVVRAAGAVFTLSLVFGLGMVLVKLLPAGTSPPAPALLALPLACSLYVFSAGAWVLPDNAGWLGVLGVLAIVLVRPVTAGMLGLAGLLLLALVLCRQTHLWTAGLIWLAPWIGAAGTGAAPDGRRRWALAGMAVLATVPAFLAVFAFASLWHGLVPPLFQGGVYDPIIGKASPKNSGGNPATPAFLLTLVAIFGVFFLAYARSAIAALLAKDRRALMCVGIGAAAGLLIGAIPATSFSQELGRYTGFWAVVKHLPVVADRSLFVVAGACAGGAMLGLFLGALARRDAIVFLAAFLGFAVAQSAAFFAWQRYLEPFVLILLALMSARLAAADAPQSRLWRLGAVAGPAALSLVLAVITWRGLH